MQDIESSKTARVDKFWERILKDSADILAKRVSTLANLSISRGVLSNACKHENVKSIFKVYFQKGKEN